MVRLRNAGDAPALPLTVEGELLGERRVARLEQGVAAGQSGEVRLAFPADLPRPGLHALTLLLEWPLGPPAVPGAIPPTASQRAYLLLSLGATAEPAVKLEPEELLLETRDRLRVDLESADGAPHRVRVRVLTPRGLNVDGEALEAEVPAKGRASVEATLLRAGAPRGSRQGILVVATAADGALERTSVATGIVRIAPDPARLPRLRPLMVLLIVLLLGGGLLEQVRRGGKRE